MTSLAFLLFLSNVPTLSRVLVMSRHWAPQAFTLTQSTSGVIPGDVLMAINNHYSPPPPRTCHTVMGQTTFPAKLCV